MIFSKDKERGPWELLTCYHHLCDWEDHGGQGADLRHPAGPHQGQAVPDQLNGFLWLHQWTRERLQMSFIWTSEKPLTQHPSL